MIETCKRCSGKIIPKRWARPTKLHAQGFCSRKCKAAYTRADKKLPWELSGVDVPCPDCFQTLQINGDYGHHGHNVLECNNEGCPVWMIEGKKVIRDSLVRSPLVFGEVDRIISIIRGTEELYNSAESIYYKYPTFANYRGNYDYPVLRQPISHWYYLTDEQQENFLRLFTPDWKLLPLVQASPQLPIAESAFKDMHTEAEVTISVSTDEATPAGDIFLLFSKPVRGIELTKGERVKLASLLLLDINQEDKKKTECTPLEVITI
jgi:hypothetical protein